MSMEIVEDTDLDSIINGFACKQVDILKLFVAVFFPKRTHWQSGRDQGDFNRFVTNYFSQPTPLQLPCNAL